MTSNMLREEERYLGIGNVDNERDNLVPSTYMNAPKRKRILWFLSKAFLLASLLVPAQAGAAALGNPSPGSFQSGVSILSGWKCEAGTITARFNGGEPVAVLYGAERSDTASHCANDGRNGFITIYNYNRLGDGEHRVEVFDDGVKFGEATFTVVTLGEEFVRGEKGQGTIRLSPSNKQVTVGWDQASQGFNITGVVEALETFCEDWKELSSPGFLYINNVWNKGNVADYEQCLLKRIVGGKNQYGWRWQWPGAEGDVKAYPEVVYGYKPWNSPTTTPDLPRQISSINQIQVNYAVELTASGTYNLAFTMWVTSTNPPTPETITHEIMIWVDRTFEPQPPEFQVAAVMIDDVTYDLYIKSDFPTTSVGHKYIAFASHPDQLSGTLNFEKFLTYLIDHDHLPTDHYVTSVELGNEVAEGTGELWLRSLQIQVD